MRHLENPVGLLRDIKKVESVFRKTFLVQKLFFKKKNKIFDQI